VGMCFLVCFFLEKVSLSLSNACLPKPQPNLVAFGGGGDGLLPGLVLKVDPPGLSTILGCSDSVP
jgi:hypothetical protein